MLALEIFHLGQRSTAIGAWRKDGTWLKVHDKLYQWVRVAAGRDPSPSEAAVDSQSVETATMISQDVGYDAGKKIHGRKRHLSVDLLGLVLRVLVTSASLPERQGAQQVLKRVHDTGYQVKRLHTIWMDGGYRGQEFMRLVMDMFRWIVEIVLRPLEKMEVLTIILSRGSPNSSKDILS